MSGTYPSAFDALPNSVKSLVATSFVPGMESLFVFGWSDEDIAELIGHFADGIGKPYVGCDQVAVLADLAKRRADWLEKKSDGHAGNGHDTSEEGAPEASTEEEEKEESAPLAVLEPNLADISAHLYAIFSPDFVQDYPDAWIEIATADPNAPDTVDRYGKVKKNTGVKSSRHFSPFELDKAAAYAVRMNQQIRNVYVGMALRQGETGEFSNGRATKDNVVTGSHGWGDFDRCGDDVRVKDALKTRGIETAEMVLTGTIPHPRFQVFLKLAGRPATPDELEAANEAIRDCLGGNGDGVQNCDRVMRLAGTVSYPPPEKVARGYVPELTKLFITKDARAYPVDELLRRLSNEPASSPSLCLAAGKAAGNGAGAQNAVSADGAANFWRKVNEMALANLGAWVPEIFGTDAVFQKGTKAYRISSSSLGRNLQEDLSIHPKGITDWGIDDQGEKPADKIGRHTAIDIVIKYGNAASAKQAALWLCEKCGVEPASLGWKAKRVAADNPTTREIERLAQLSRVDYERERKKAAKELGFRTKVLDDLVGQMREDEQKEEVVDEIARLNADYAMVLAGNKAAIMKFEDGPTKFRLLQVGAFKMWFANQFVTIGKTTVSLGEYWLSHPERRQYAGIEFAPPGTATTPNYYNLWQGFAVERRKGDCSKLLAHVRDNMARGDEATFLWTIGWWAAVFQLPSTKMETALAFRGPQGAGKTKLGEVMGTLIPQHYRLVASPRYITGQFNSHMASLLVLQADEAFWAGDKKSEGILKDLISGKDHMLEYKGVDPIYIKNFIRLYATGNSDWMVPASFRDRRWAIFDIGEDKMQDNAYFAAIDEEMNNGGREALLDYLLDFDLSQVNLRVIPKTAALFDQQIESMNAEQSWWLDLLMGGTLPTLHGLEEANLCSCEALHSWYILRAQQQGASYRSSQTKLGIFLKKQLGDGVQHTRPEIKVVRRQADGSTKTVPLGLNNRPWCYRLPPLKECRERFVAKLGQPVDWGEGWEQGTWAYAIWNASPTFDIPVLPENEG